MSLFKTQISKDTSSHIKILNTFNLIGPVYISSHFSNFDNNSQVFSQGHSHHFFFYTIMTTPNINSSPERFSTVTRWQSFGINRVSATFILLNSSKHDIQVSTFSERGGEFPRVPKCGSTISLLSKYHVCRLDKLCSPGARIDCCRNIVVMLHEKETALRCTGEFESS